MFRVKLTFAMKGATSSRQRPERRGFDQMLYEQHRQRLRKIAPLIDNKKPAEKPFSDRWEQEKRREFDRIDVDNKFMLERLAKAVEKGRIDNKMHKSIDFHRNFKAQQQINHRRHKLAEVTRENQELLKRIQEIPPVYNHLQWEDDNRRSDAIIRTMALYPEYYEKKDAEKRMKRLEKMRIKQGLALSVESSLVRAKSAPSTGRYHYR